MVKLVGSSALRCGGRVSTFSLLASSAVSPLFLTLSLPLRLAEGVSGEVQLAPESQPSRPQKQIGIDGSRPPRT